MLYVIRYELKVLFFFFLKIKHEHVTDCADDDTAGKDDQLQREIGKRYRRGKTEQRYAILEYVICMTTLRIVKTTLKYVVYTDGNTPYVGRH